MSCRAGPAFTTIEVFLDPSLKGVSSGVTSYYDTRSLALPAHQSAQRVEGQTHRAHSVY